MRASAAMGWYLCVMDIIDDEALHDALLELDGWRREGGAILRDFRLPSFLAAIGFIGRIAVLAEDADHHPEITNVYRDVAIRLTTHDAGGVTQRDLALARAIDAVVGEES